jgi:ppGpp synthetase/RelA/SpoT-type nucleotidyltranferase
MDAGWSKSRISRLGKALISTNPPPVDRLHELHELLIVYDEALDAAVARIREDVHVQLTSRLKNTGTILEKLRRNGGGSLPNVQDLAGIRIVLDCDLTEQMRFARRIESLFAAEDRPPKIIDRTDEGLRGYRAVHVIVTVAGRPVEVQIRTRLQHQWANLFEKFADIVGRGIRYGEPPDEWTMIFDVSFERLVHDDTSSSRILAHEVGGGQDLVSLIIKYFEIMSSEIHACEVAATFHGTPELFEQTSPPDELPSLEEVERRKEVVLETALVMERVFGGLLATRAAFATELEAIKSELSTSGGLPETSVLDREVLRAELRKLVGLADGSSPSGDDSDPADGGDSEG